MVYITYDNLIKMPKKTTKPHEEPGDKIEGVFSDLKGSENTITKKAKIGVVRGQNMVRIPQIISEELKIKPGDYFRFTLNYDPEKPRAKPELIIKLAKDVNAKA